MKRILVLAIVGAAALLILPGGDSWLAGADHGGAVELARRFLSAGIPVAAICGAWAASTSIEMVPTTGVSRCDSVSSPSAMAATTIRGRR